MMNRTLIALSVGLGLPMFGLGILPSARAEAYQAGESCELKQTSDGFVALRKTPSIKSKRIKKLYVGDFRVSPIGPVNAWVKVVAGQPEGWSGTGYVRSDLVDWNNCNNAG